MIATLPPATVAPAPAALGAPYPGTRFATPPHMRSEVDATSHRRACYVNYRLRTDAPIAAVDRFYRAQGQAAGATVIDDTVGRLPGFGIIAFARPRFMSVVFSREATTTLVVVTYAVRCPG